MKHWYDNEISQGIFANKYYHEGEKNPEEVIERVSNIFKGELHDDFKESFKNGDLSPAGRTIYGAGAKGKFKATLSNCYIMPSPEDNLESIYRVNGEIARIFSYGGGIGVNISKLRPRDAAVNNAAKTSTGAVSFLKVFDSTGEVIAQNGRRGAIMVGLDCSHPDIYEFLHIKQNNEKLASMNISILFTDEFMEAVDKDEEYELHFVVEATGQEIKRTIKARDFFKEYCQTQWDWGDPGALFVDKLRGYNMLSGYPEYHLDITNPCGEFAGNAYNSCNLLSINLYNMIDDKFEDSAHLNEEKLRHTVRVAIRSLDKILDYGYDTQPLDANRECIDDWRSVGLGVLGLADALVAMRLKYGTKEANEFTANIMKMIFLEAANENTIMASEMGTFRKYDFKKTDKSPLVQMIKKEAPKTYENIKKYGFRNGTLLSVAPTGTISLMLGALTGGCEPIYQICYERTSHKMEDAGKTFRVYARSINDMLEHYGLNNLSAKEVKERFPWVIESHDVPYENRVALQSAMQLYVDNSISSTVNLKHEATADDIFKIYMDAWKTGCKGITVFRDGCKRGNILGVSKKEEKQENDVIKYDSIHPVKRAKVPSVEGRTMVRHTACVDKMYVTVNHTPEKEVFEIFTNASGGCQSNIATITRLASLALRSGTSVEDVCRQMEVMKCPACQTLIRQGKKNISLSCGSAIASALREAYNNLKDEKGKHIKSEEEKNAAINVECPSCHHHTLKPDGKCVTCTRCGWSRCE